MTSTDHTEALSELHDALFDLPSRHAWLVALAERRDVHARAGNHKSARVWQALAILVAELGDAEDATLKALEFTPGASGGVLELPGE